jgi:hypothetical protein
MDQIDYLVHYFPDPTDLVDPKVLKGLIHYLVDYFLDLKGLADLADHLGH